ncbi:MAG: TonB-dependent receptor [Chitinophagaceae bacterium]|nr:TonB-dependent receptor [Chitinophagaceae bacterium]
MRLTTKELLKNGCTVALLLLSYGVLAQKTVTGRIINNNDKQPLPGASVQVKGTQIISQSQTDGNFSLNVPANYNILVITVVGFETMEVNLSATPTPGVISLKPSTASLNEVIVTGYTAQRKKDITGAVSVINVDNIKNIPSGTIESVLQGQASGLTVINNGAPGGPSNVRVRGITSVGNVDPLVIIDGTPGNMHDLNPNDIQSIQVLKDAGSAAIYGVRGSNGVIIITTKKGKQGPARVTYDAYIGSQRPLKNGWNLANPTENANAIWEQYKNSGLVASHKQYGNGPTPVIPDYITPTAGIAGQPNTDPATYKLYTNQITKANKEGTDWFHEIFKPALLQSHNVSVSGGNDKSAYLFSLNYLNQDGTLIHNYLRRYSARINTLFNVGKNIRIGENAYVAYKKNPGYLGLPGVNNANSINAAYRMPAIVPVYDITGKNFAGGGSQSLGNSPNPVAIMERTKNNKGNSWQISGNVFAELDLMKHFTVRTSFGGTVENFYNNAFVFTAYENAENSSNPNSFIESSGFSSSWTWTNTLNYTNIFATKHRVNALIGSEAISNYARGISGSRGSYFITDLSNLTVDPNLWTLNFGTPTGQQNSNILVNGIQSPYESSLFSLFGRVDYAFDDKYLLSGTLRRDGSSVFSSESRYGVFPSITAGWRISSEKFMQGVTWLNDLKIRGGWGKLGSLSNINPTNAYTLFGSSSVYSYYDINGSSTSPTLGLFTAQYGNQATTWEEDIITNIGFDATLFNNTLELSMEWYKKDIKGLLYRPVAPASVGAATLPFINVGNIQNKGIDLSAIYHGKINKDLGFDITATFTSYNNKVISLPAGTLYFDYGNSRLQPGQPIGAFFGYKQIGLFQSAADVSGSPTQEAAAPGRHKFADVNGDKVINAQDRTHFGDPNPDFTAGLNLGVNYKNFDLFVFVYASVGNDVINNVRASIDFPQVFDVAISKDAVYNSWTPDRPNAKVPRLERSANFSNTTQFNSYYLEDGSFLRCKALTLGYNLPGNMIQRFGITKFRIYVQALNLFTLTKYTGLDPELSGPVLTSTNFGNDGGAYPANQKAYTVGINLSF